MIGIYAYLIAQFIRPQDFMPFMLGFPVVDIIVSLTLLFGLMNLMKEKKLIVLPQTYLIILYLFAVVISNVVNNNSDLIAERFIFFLKGAAIFFMFLSVINSKQELKRTLFFIIILTVFLAIQAIYQSKYGINFSGQTLTPGYDEIRVRWVGMWDGPNVLCLLFTIAIPFALEFVFGPYSVLFRMVNLVFTFLLSYGIYLTNSRGGFIAFVATIFFYFLFKIRDKKKGIILGLSLGLTLVMFLAPSRMSEIRGESSAHQRSWIWERGINLFMEKPILGIGKGQFRSEHGEVAHNNFVENMTDMGLIGLFLFIGIIYLSFKGLYIVYGILMKTKKNIKMLSLARCLLVSLVAYNVSTFFVTMEHDIMFLWWGLCAVAFNIAKNEIPKMQFRFSLGDARNISLIMMTIIAVVYIIVTKDIV